MPNRPSSAGSQGPGSTEASGEASVVHKMALKVYRKHFNVEG